MRFADSELNLKHIYNYYSQVCPNFYTHLNEDLKKKLSYRLNIRNNWNELELLKEKCSLATLEYKHRLDFFKSVSSAKIVVCSYFSTTFLELMAANLPVILFSNFSLESYNNVTIKSFKDMKKNKIYFDDFKKGATFINNNWNKIN